MKIKVGIWFTQSIRLHKLPNPIYKTVPNQIHSTTFVPWGLNQIYPTKSIEPNLPNQTNKSESAKSDLASKNLKCKEPNIPNQIY